ncbi:MAG TPA: Hsp20/alpha crystallin family protein [Sphingobacteriaceae bacterium]
MTLVKFANPQKTNAVKPWVNDVFDTFFNDSFVSDRMVSRVPAVNIAETEGNYQIELAAPGLKKEDFKINVDKNTLSISVEKKTEAVQENKKFNRREFSYSSFVRTFSLPDTIDYSGIDARYTDGILTIELAKKEEAKIQTREIEVK